MQHDVVEVGVSQYFITLRFEENVTDLKATSDLVSKMVSSTPFGPFTISKNFFQRSVAVTPAVLLSCRQPNFY